MIPSRGSAIAGFSPHVAGAALRRVLASRLRRDREVRCDAGAAPATVSGEIATRSHWRRGAAGKVPRSTTPSQETSSLRRCFATILGRRSVLPDRVEASPRRSEKHTSELQSRQYLVCRL